MIESSIDLDPRDPRLRRQRIHDSRNRAHNAVDALGARRPGVHLQSVLHERRGPVFDQGQIGMCTAMAGLGLMMTGRLASGVTYTEDDGKGLYREETRLDDSIIPGQWEPDDTGSTGQYAMQALRNRGLIRAYGWAFGLEEVLQVLQVQPVCLGTAWYESMYDPDPRTGVIDVRSASGTAGGHEYLADGVDIVRELVHITNSWSTGWGIGGGAWLTFAGLRRLLGDGGDAVTALR